MMINCKHISLLITALFLNAVIAKSQDKPIGYWESHLPYNNAVGLATDGSTIFAICNQPFFTYQPSSDQLEPYSKVNGMSDIGMQAVGYDATTGTTVLVYSNGNIDLFKNNTFYNIPDLKIKSIAGNKTVNQIYCEAGTAYLCTSIGILVIDLATHNINETYQFIFHAANASVNGFTSSGKYFYAATDAGLYRAEKTNTQLQNFQVWTNIDSTDTISYITTVNDKVFFANDRSVYCSVNDTFLRVYSCSGSADTFITHIDAGNNALLISEFKPKQFSGNVRVMDTSFSFTGLLNTVGNPKQAVQLNDNSIWIADGYYGLINQNLYNRHYPSGPSDPNSFDIYAYNKNLWLVHGGISDKLDAIQNFHCASNYVDGNWKYYERGIYPTFNAYTTGVAVTKNERSGDLYIGSFVWGLFTLKADGTTEILNGSTSIFDSSVALFGVGQRQIAGMTLDPSENLWVTLAYARAQLYVKTPENEWYKFQVPGGFSGGPVTIDDNGNAWFVCLNNGGVAVYNTNGTISDVSDDASYHMNTGVGNGNLPSNNVHCIAKDKNNNIWIGSDNGIGIVSNCSFPSGQTAVCDATIPIVKYDQFAGYLFAGNNVKSIAVDGANRKWVGTEDGVWLLSSDAQKIIYRFTTDNSPLPSNKIQKIFIDKVTGDVYIGTDEGLVSYHSTATDTNSVTKSVTIFPNPVTKDYTGTIAIKGLPVNADVRITDINDQLVYRTTALGSQAVWNGRDYKGHKPQTGVYMVYATNADGTQTYAGKIVFMQ